MSRTPAPGIVDLTSRRRRVDIIDVLDTAPTTEYAIAEIAPDPRNLRQRMDEEALKELAAGIKAVGVLAPLLLVTREAYMAAMPDTLIGASTRWVAVCGNRRLAAAAIAGLTHVPARVVDDIASDRELAQLLENRQREGLSPIAEARGYEAVMRRGKLSQRKVAAAFSVTHTQLQHRVRLLSLPEPIIEAIDRGDLNAFAGRRLADAFGDDAEKALAAYARITGAGDKPGLSVDSAIQEVLELDRVRKMTELSLAELARLGVEPIDPAHLWGKRAAEHLVDQDLTAAQRKREHPQCLAAAVDPEDGCIVWYCTDLARHGLRDDDEVQARRAAAARARYATKAADSWPGHPASAVVLADAAIAAARPGTALRLATAWAKDAGLIPSDVAEREPAEVLEWIGWALEGQRRVHFACVLAMAHDEAAARRTTEWGRREQAHIERLRDVGYAPSQWEVERLAATAASAGPLAGAVPRNPPADGIVPPYASSAGGTT